MGKHMKVTRSVPETPGGGARLRRSSGVYNARVTSSAQPRMEPRMVSLLTAQVPEVRATDLDLLNATGMAGWVCSRLPADHIMRPPLEPARIGLLAHQMMIRRSMVALLRGFGEAGVESVLLAGFMLAEFAYRVPGVRSYGDVDLMVHPEQLSRLLEVAQRLGWKDDGKAGRPAEWTHEIAHLSSPDGQVRLDVHRYVAPWSAGPSVQARRLTRAVWQASESEMLDGVPVRRPAWEDCALNLVLNRSWSGDCGEYKPVDYTDLDALAGCSGVTPSNLEKRAKALGALHTWRAFLAGCDPWLRHFEYGSAVRSSLVRHAAWRDGAAWPLSECLRKVRRLPIIACSMRLVLPDVLAARRSLQVRGADPRELVRQMVSVAVAGNAAASDEQVNSVVSGVKWLTPLFYPQSPGVCVPRSLATYRALRRIGFPAVYVSGVHRNVHGVIEGHAWVEGPQGQIEAYGEPMNRQMFQTVFEER